VVGAGGVGSVVEEGDRTERFAVGPPADASRLVRAWLSEG
jgi:hypothetical protein